MKYDIHGNLKKKKFLSRVWRGQVPFPTVFWVLGVALPVILVIGCNMSISGLSHVIADRSVEIAIKINAYPRHGNRYPLLRQFFNYKADIAAVAVFIVSLALLYILWISVVLWRLVFRAVEAPKAYYIWGYATVLFFFSITCMCLLVAYSYSPGSFYNATGKFRIIGKYDNTCECRMDTSDGCTFTPDFCVLQIGGPGINHVHLPD